MADALSPIEEWADIVTRERGGTRVVQLIEAMLAGRLDELRSVEW